MITLSHGARGTYAPPMHILRVSLSLHGRYTDWLPLSLRQRICVYLEVVPTSMKTTHSPIFKFQRAWWIIPPSYTPYVYRMHGALPNFPPINKRSFTAQMRRLVHHHPSRSFCKSSVKQCLLSIPSWFEGLPSTLHIKAISCFGDALWKLFVTYLDFGSLDHLGSILPECSGKSRVPKAFCRSFSFAITAWSPESAQAQTMQWT
jgi:hypothetical protein